MKKKFIFCLLLLFSGVTSAEQAVQTATFAGGCFWRTQVFFSEIEGVTEVRAGYTGGQLSNPSHQQVFSGETGHAEAVELTFESDKISYADLVEIHLLTHDPTVVEQAGYKPGPQTRTAIFYHTLEQRAIAKSVLSRLSRDVYKKPLLTELAAASDFYPADNYHQNFYKRNPKQSYCVRIIKPSLEKFRSQFGSKLKTKE